MTNLSDLFPAGAGKQVSFTASGNVTSSGKPVILNSDGTVTQVSGSSESLGSTTNPLVQNADSYNGFAGQQRQAIYDTTADRIIVASNCQQNGANDEVRLIAGQVSGTSCTFGSSIAVASSTTGTGVNAPGFGCSLCFDSDNGFPLVFVQSGDSSYFQYPVLVPIVVSGSSLSLGTPLVIQSAACTSFANFCTYDTTNDKVLCVYGDATSSNVMRAAVVTVSSTSSLSVTGSPVSEPNSYAINQNWALTYSPDADLHAFVGTLYGNAQVATTIDISTGSAVWNSAVTTTESASSAGYYSTLTYDSSAQAFIATSYATYDGSTTYNNPIVPFAVSGTGSSVTVSVGTKGFTGPDLSINYYAAAVYDPVKNVTAVAFNVSGGANYVSVTLTGSSPYTASAGAVNTLYSSGNNVGGGLMFGTYDTDTSQICFLGGYTANNANAVMLQPGTTNLTSTNFLGISDAAISSAASGNITMKGGIAATGLSSLTPGSDYYVQDDGTITTVSSSVKAGKALSATAINLEYTS